MMASFMSETSCALYAAGFGPGLTIAKLVDQPLAAWYLQPFTGASASPVSIPIPTRRQARRIGSPAPYGSTRLFSPWAWGAVIPKLGESLG